MTPTFKQAIRDVVRGAGYTLIACIAVLLAGLFLMGWLFPTSFKESADDYDGLMKLGLIQGGWFPETLPKSVRNINVSWDLDSASANAAFDVPVEDIDRLVSAYELETSSGSIQRYKREVEDTLSNHLETLNINRKTGHVLWSTRRVHRPLD